MSSEQVDQFAVMRVFAVADALNSDCEPFASAEDRLKRLDQVRNQVGSWSLERLLDSNGLNRARVERYERASWTRELVSLDALAVWPGAGGLPLSICGCSVIATAERVMHLPNLPPRLARFIESMNSDSAATVALCGAIPLIAMSECLIHRVPRPGVELSLDDGSHRAIVLALHAPSTPVAMLVGRRLERTK